MADREWWETAQQLGLSWLSPRKDSSPSDEILCMLSDLCTKENFPPPSFQQFPAANGTFSSICQIGDYTKESYGESADIALRNAAVTMLIFLKELKATAVTHQLKEKKNDVNLPSLHKEILKENQYDVNLPTIRKEILKENKYDANLPNHHKEIFSFHQENGSNCVRKDEAEMFQKRFAEENEIEHYDKLEHRSRLENRPDRIKKLYTQKNISNSKKPMKKKEVSDFGNKKATKHDKHPSGMEPQGRPSDYTKQNLKDYPPEILEMYQSYQKECQSSEDLLSLDEIWNQCVADSILPDSLMDNQTKFQQTTRKKIPPNGIEMNQFQSRIKNLSELNQSNLQETFKFKDGKHYRSEMIHHASGHQSKADDKTFSHAHANSHLSKADHETFRHDGGRLTKADHETYRHDGGRLTKADVQTLRHANGHLSEAGHEMFLQLVRHASGHLPRTDEETFRHANDHLSKADDKSFRHASGHLSNADHESFRHANDHVSKRDHKSFLHASGHLSQVDYETFLPMGKKEPKIPPEVSQYKVQENVFPGSIEDECFFQNNEANESMDELSPDFIQKLEKMQIERVSPQKHKTLNGFFLILGSSRNPGMGKLRYSKLGGDYVAHLEEICEEEKIAFGFEEEEIEVHRGVDDEWLSVLRLGHDMEFIGSGASSGEAKQMACLSALQYIKIMTR